MSEFANMLAKVLRDPNPDMKNAAANLAGQFCEALPDKSGIHMKRVVESLTFNLQHQHSAVRKNTLRALKVVIATNGAEDNL